MSQAKKMILVDPETLERLHQQSSSSVKNKMNGLDQEMDKIINDRHLTDSEKWTHYNQILQRFLHFNHEIRQPLHIPIVSAESVPSNRSEISSQSLPKVDHIKYQTLQALPKLKRNVGELLYDTLTKSDKVTWDEQGRVTVNGRELVGSSITDLISDVVRDRKTSNPEGWTAFSEVLYEMNIPQEYIQNSRRREFIALRRQGKSTPPRGIPHSLGQRKREIRVYPGAVRKPSWEKYKF